MCLDYYAIEIIAKARQEQLLADAKITNLSKAVKPKRTNFRERMLLRFGERLVLLGSRIKTRYQPSLYPDSAELRTNRGTGTCIS